MKAVEAVLAQCSSPLKLSRIAGTVRAASSSLAASQSSSLNSDVTRTLVNSPSQLMRGLHVLKFGGSSVGNSTAFRNVAGVLLAEKDAGYQ